MKKLLLLSVVLLFCLASCTSEKINLPAPLDLFDEISQKTVTTHMYDLTDEMLEDVIGISPNCYKSAVYMTPGTGISPEEIIIVKANTEEDADFIEEKFKKRLAYIKKSAENYLIEEMPMIEEAVIRRDGITVSLIVSPKVDGIVDIYNKYN